MLPHPHTALTWDQTECPMCHAQAATMMRVEDPHTFWCTCRCGSSWHVTGRDG